MGSLLKAGSTYYGVTSILIAEARVMRDSVCASIEEGFKHMVIEGDNKIVMQVLQGIIIGPWHQSLIKDVTMWKKNGIHVIINQVFKEANMIAVWTFNF